VSCYNRWVALEPVEWDIDVWEVAHIMLHEGVEKDWHRNAGVARTGQPNRNCKIGRQREKAIYWLEPAEILAGVLLGNGLLHQMVYW